MKTKKNSLGRVRSYRDAHWEPAPPQRPQQPKARQLGKAAHNAIARSSALKSKRRKAKFDLPSVEVPSSAVLDSLSSPHRAKAAMLPRQSPSDADLVSKNRGTQEAAIILSPELKPPPASLLSDSILAIKEVHRRRQDFLNAEGALARQIKSILRRLNKAEETKAQLAPPTIKSSPSSPLQAVDDRNRFDDPIGNVVNGLDPNEEGDEGHEWKDGRILPADVSYPPLIPLQEAQAMMRKHRLAEERILKKLAEYLPPYKTFWAPIRGLGAMGLGQIIGESGDLSRYANPAKLWKRFGVGLVNGQRQRKVANNPALAIAMGYNARRRSLLFVLTDSLLRQQGPYRELYLSRKALEETKVPEGPKMLWHRRAQRYVGKRLLRDLWRAWRDHERRDIQSTSVSAPANPLPPTAPIGRTVHHNAGSARDVRVTG